MTAAIPELAHLLGNDRLRPQVQKLIAQCHALRISRREADQAGHTLGARLADKDFWLVPAGSDVTLIAFCAQERPDVYIRFMHYYLQRHRINAIYVFDTANVYYLAGIRGLGDSVAATTYNLRRLVGELGTRWLLCFGLSSGGYAALRYGLELGANGILAFSPIILQIMEGERLERIIKTLAYIPDPVEHDLVRRFVARDFTSLVKIVYAGNNVEDTNSAQHLKGIPGVSLHCLAGIDHHNTLHQLSQSGEFSGLLREFVDEVVNICSAEWRFTREGTASKQPCG